VRGVVLLVVAVGAVAGAVGVLAGRRFWSHASAPRPVPSHGFVVTSSYATPEADRMGGFRLRVGATADEPRWGAVLFEQIDQGQLPGHGAKLVTVPEAPVLLTAPQPTGPLRIVQTEGHEFLLRSSGGWLYSLEFESNLTVPTMYPLGRRLDPRRLPALPRRGFVVPVTYGRRHSRRAVLLVAFPAYSPTLYGRLDGFALPRPKTKTGLLDRPLLGPDRALYRVDVRARRLVRVSPPDPERRPWQPSYPERGCASWPGRGSRYEACPGSITRVAPDGERRPVFTDPRCDALCRTQSEWQVVLPSPDGRTLLAGEATFGCGELSTAYFLPAMGGERTELMRTADVESVVPIGWLNGHDALVATDGLADCDANQSTISSIDPRYPDDRTVVANANGHDVTVWGR